jgi:hypothetical protein
MPRQAGKSSMPRRYFRGQYSGTRGALETRQGSACLAARVRVVSGPRFDVRIPSEVAGVLAPSEVALAGPLGHELIAERSSGLSRWDGHYQPEQRVARRDT